MRTFSFFAVVLALLLVAVSGASAFTVDSRNSSDPGSRKAFYGSDESSGTFTGGSDDGGLGVTTRSSDPFSRQRQVLPNAEQIGHPDSDHLYWGNSSNWGRNAGGR